MALVDQHVPKAASHQATLRASSALLQPCVAPTHTTTRVLMVPYTQKTNSALKESYFHARNFRVGLSSFTWWHSPDAQRFGRCTTFYLTFRNGRCTRKQRACRWFLVPLSLEEFFEIRIEILIQHTIQ